MPSSRHGAASVGDEETKNRLQPFCVSTGNVRSKTRLVPHAAEGRENAPQSLIAATERTRFVATDTPFVGSMPARYFESGAKPVSSSLVTDAEARWFETPNQWSS